ncbi:hypothetical protein BDV12DRAFT_179615 [Aspergillus spectabilis]
MPQGTEKDKESFFERVLDHHHHHKQENKSQGDKKGEGGFEDRLRGDMKKDEHGMKEYLKEDEELEQEGQTYGGLM